MAVAFESAFASSGSPDSKAAEAQLRMAAVNLRSTTSASGSSKSRKTSLAAAVDITDGLKSSNAAGDGMVRLNTVDVRYNDTGAG